MIWSDYTHCQRSGSKDCCRSSLYYNGSLMFQEFTSWRSYNGFRVKLKFMNSSGSEESESWSFLSGEFIGESSSSIWVNYSLVRGFWRGMHFLTSARYFWMYFWVWDSLAWFLSIRAKYCSVNEFMVSLVFSKVFLSSKRLGIAFIWD
jgi:hypothetical protein